NTVAGATSQNLSLIGVPVGESGSYQVIANNSVGAVGSTTATLTVQLPDAFSTNCVAAPSGLVDWWSGDGNAYDLIGDGDGSLLNGVQFVAGKDDAALSFDAINDYVTVPCGGWCHFKTADQITYMARIALPPR